MGTEINYIDLFLLLPLLWALYKGFRKGLILEIAALVSLIGGIYIAVKFSGFVGDNLAPHLEVSEQWLGIIAFIITFIVVVILVNLMGKLLEKTIQLIALGFVNRLGGAIFSLLKTALIISFILFLFQQLDANFSIISKETKEGSLLYQPLQKIAPNLLPVIQDLELQDYINENDTTSV